MIVKVEEEKLQYCLASESKDNSRPKKKKAYSIIYYNAYHTHFHKIVCGERVVLCFRCVSFIGLYLMFFFHSLYLQTASCHLLLIND